MVGCAPAGPGTRGRSKERAGLQRRGSSPGRVGWQKLVARHGSGPNAPTPRLAFVPAGMQGRHFYVL